jgi:hypothetical protein
MIKDWNKLREFVTSGLTLNHNLRKLKLTSLNRNFFSGKKLTDTYTIHPAKTPEMKPDPQRATKKTTASSILLKAKCVQSNLKNQLDSLFERRRLNQ